MEYKMKKLFSLTILTLSLLISNFPLCSANDPAIVQEMENRLNKAKEEMPFLETKETLNEWLSAQDRTGEEVVEALVKSKKILNEMLEPIIKHAVETRQRLKEVHESHTEELQNKPLIFVHDNLWYIDRSVATMIKDDTNKKLKESIERALEKLFSKGISATDNTPFYRWVVMRIRKLSALKDASLKEELLGKFLGVFADPIKLFEKHYRVVPQIFPEEEIFEAFSERVKRGFVEGRKEIKEELENLFESKPYLPFAVKTRFTELVGQEKLDSFGLMSLTEDEAREADELRKRYEEEIAKIKKELTGISDFEERKDHFESTYEHAFPYYRPNNVNFKPFLRKLLFTKENVYEGNEKAFFETYGEDLSFNLELKETKKWPRFVYKPSPDELPQLSNKFAQLKEELQKEAQQSFVKLLKSPAQPGPTTTSRVLKGGVITVAVAAAVLAAIAATERGRKWLKSFFKKEEQEATASQVQAEQQTEPAAATATPTPAEAEDVWF